MARSKFNVLTHGLSGLVGDMLVFRQKAGKTFVSGRPKPSTKPLKAIALTIRDRFKRAASYAASVMSNLTLKDEYQLTAKPGQSAYNMAFSDYQKAPEIYEDINLSVYTGAIGEEIEVSVIDDFRVESVSVEIKTSSGTLIEQGDAVQSPNGLDWVYTTTAVNAEVPGTRITFTAKDLPGNETVLEKILI
ncbi:hypothetical protein [Daejeonella lutea]|uniref:Uncharacterized protein n=1 Tax=Daejeonella lutea TaxID=572036 RepID=A0A1T5CXW1_9SPHI|nr:hypothetical protein [Daejeonella lutea]SKB64176.1 hypothetical protein SAMN05661099_1999 [Daejeonella lutea]